MQNSNTAALLVLNQLHPEKTGALPSRTSALSSPLQPGQSSVQPREDPQVSGQAGNDNVQPRQDPQVSGETGLDNVQLQVPGQAGNGNVQPQVSGQSGHTNVQPEEDPISEGYDSPSDSVPDASPTDDFTEVFRTGNFGTHFGKLNVQRGKRWAIVHGVLASFMFVFSLTASIMLRNYTTLVIRQMLLAFIWMAALSDWCTVFSAVFLIWRLSTLRHPFSLLILLRFSAVFNIMLNFLFFMVCFLGLILKEKDFVQMTSGEIEFLKSIFVIISLLMVVKMVTGYAFICLWWGCDTCYHAFAGAYCVFEKGEMLAPGVANSAGVLKVFRVAQVAAVVGQTMDRVENRLEEMQNNENASFRV